MIYKLKHNRRIVMQSQRLPIGDAIIDNRFTWTTKIEWSSTASTSSSSLRDTRHHSITFNANPQEKTARQRSKGKKCKSECERAREEWNFTLNGRSKRRRQHTIWKLMHEQMSESQSRRRRHFLCCLLFYKSIKMKSTQVWNFALECACRIDDQSTGGFNSHKHTRAIVGKMYNENGENSWTSLLLLHLAKNKNNTRNGQTHGRLTSDEKKRRAKVKANERKMKKWKCKKATKKVSDKINVEMAANEAIHGRTAIIDAPNDVKIRIHKRNETKSEKKREWNHRKKRNGIQPSSWMNSDSLFMHYMFQMWLLRWSKNWSTNIAEIRYDKPQRARLTCESTFQCWFTIKSWNCLPSYQKFVMSLP